MQRSQHLRALLVAAAAAISGCQEVTGLTDLRVADAGSGSQSATATTGSGAATGTGGAGAATGGMAGDGGAAGDGGTGGVVLPMPCSPTSTDALRDDFADDVIGPEWQAQERAGIHFLETGGELLAEIDPNVGAAQTSALVSTDTYDFTACHSTIRVTEVPTGPGSAGMLILGPTGWDDRVELAYIHGELRFATYLDHVPTPVDVVSYVASQHVWWRMAEEAGSVLFQASDGGAFETLASALLPFDPSQTRIALFGGAEQSGEPGGRLRFDDLNRKP
jgi:hypothetical protein